jgi:hypothetical protein
VQQEVRRQNTARLLQTQTVDGAAATSLSISCRQAGALALKSQETAGSAASALPEADSFIKVCNAVLRKVDGKGAAVGDEIRGASLFADSAAVIFATRRPG